MKKFKKIAASVAALATAVMMSLGTLAAMAKEASLEVEKDTFERYGMGCIPDTPEINENEYVHYEYNDEKYVVNSKTAKMLTTLPSSCDLSTNSNSGYFPPIGNQEEIGSCAAWATTYYQYTYAANKLNGIVSTASTAYSPAFTYNLASGNVANGSRPSDIYDILEHHGSLTLSQMPYEGTTPANYNYSWPTDTSAMMDALKTRVSSKGLTNISSNGTIITSNTDSDLSAVKTLLNSGHRLLVEVDAER